VHDGLEKLLATFRDTLPNETTVYESGLLIKKPNAFTVALDEFTFRFNQPKSKHRGMLFYRLIEGAVATEPHPYKRVKAA